MRTITAIICALIAMAHTVISEETQPAPAGMILIAGGSYKPLYEKEAKPRVVESFFMDVVQVTNGEFLEFVKRHPEWRRARVSRTLADANYLRHWAGDLDLGESHIRDAPVTNVSWFAANAYCKAHDKRLPTQDEWEFAARADVTRTDASTDPEFVRELLAWYSRPANAGLPPVKQGTINVHGLRGLHGVVWEWVEDFNSTMIVGDSRGDGSLEQRLFCGAGSLLTSDPSNYAAYMRYAFRSSLKGNYCVGSLGFRAARSMDARTRPTTTAGQPEIPLEVKGKWLTQRNQEFAWESLRGKVRVVTLGYTSCQYACPVMVSDMQRIATSLGEDASKVGFVFVSINPERDTPEKMAQFAADRSLDPKSWTVVSGSSEGVQELAVLLGLKYQQVGKEFAHSNVITVLDKRGAIAHRHEGLGTDISATVSAVRRFLAKP